MKKIISIIILVVMLLSMSITVNAYNTAKSLPSEYKVQDIFGVLSDEEKYDINDKIQNMVQEQYVDMMIVLKDSNIKLEDDVELTSEYVLDFFLKNGYGMGPDNNGIIAIYDNADDSVEITKVGSAKSFLTDKNTATLKSKLSTQLKDEKNYKGLVSFIDDTQKYLAENIKKGNPNKVVDNANLLTDEEEKMLLENIKSTKEQVKMDIAVVTIDTTNNVSMMDYTDDYYDYNHYGDGENNTGILLLIAIKDREIWITTTGDAISTFDSSIDSMVSSVTSKLSDANYYEACNVFNKEIIDVVLNPFNLNDFFIALIIGLIVAGIVCFILARQLKSVKKQNLATEYVREGSLEIEKSQDIFLYKNVTSTVRAKSSGGGGSHSGSSGSSHGGGGGSF